MGIRVNEWGPSMANTTLYQQMLVGLLLNTAPYFKREDNPGMKREEYEDSGRGRVSIVKPTSEAATVLDMKHVR